MSGKIRGIVLTWGLVLLMAACATNKDLRTLRTELTAAQAAQTRDLKAMQAQVEKMDKTVQNVRETNSSVVAFQDEIRGELTALKAKTKELESYWVGAQGKTPSQEIAELKMRLAALEALVNTSYPPGAMLGSQPTTIKVNPESEYQKAQQALKQGDFQKAKELYNQFLRQFPKDTNTPGAQFGLAECNYALKDYERAILEFDDFIKKYPDDKRAAEAMVKLGLSFFALKDMKSSSLIFQDVIKKFPQSEQAEVARRKLKQIP